MCNNNFEKYVSNYLKWYLCADERKGKRTTYN